MLDQPPQLGEKGRAYRPVDHSVIGRKRHRKSLAGHDRAALHDGRAQAGFVGSVVWQSELAAGRVDPHRVEILWTTPAYDHHVLDALPALPEQTAKELTRMLCDMRWNNPKHKKLLDIEGHRQWLPGRDGGYAQVVAALDDQRGW